MTYALNAEGKLVHVDSVPNGKACGCFCTYCGEPLQAKQGEKRKHHFSHLSGTECKGGVESMLHLLAKEKIQEAFYNNASFFIEFAYASFCNQEKCIFQPPSERCCDWITKRFDIKQWYDTCEQEISYDNIRRRSDLKFYSKQVPERKPVYIEFCVTHASDEAKLHSGNKIIEILIEDEESIFSLIQSGIVEKTIAVGDGWQEKLVKLVAFYGFKVEDHNNSSVSKDVKITRCVFYESGEIYATLEYCNCKHIEKKNPRALCEIVFSAFSPFEACKYAYNLCFPKYQIGNCNSCRNYVFGTAWFGQIYKMCKMYKRLHLPFEDFERPGAFDTSRANTCPFYYLDEPDLDKDVEYVLL